MEPDLPVVRSCIVAMLLKSMCGSNFVRHTADITCALFPNTSDRRLLSAPTS